MTLEKKPFKAFPKEPWFLCTCKTSLLKTWWEKEKLHITSNFFFSQGFLPVSRTFRHFQIPNCRRLQTLLVWDGLKFVVWERIKKILEKRENSGYHFLLFQLRFLPFSDKFQYRSNYQ